MPIAVNQQSEEVKDLAEQWPVLEALMQGTPAMRAGAQAYLPRWPNESAESFAARLATATLTPLYRRTVRVMAGKPFSKDVTLSEESPASIKTWSEDIDLQGVSLHSFAAEMFEETFYGLAGILVDYPRVGPAPNGVRTVAQVEATGARPYWVRVKHNQILGWRAANIAGKMKLTQLRLLESVEEDDGEWGTKVVQQVRVLTPGAWRIYQASTVKADKGAWKLVGQGVTSLADIPFVPLYGSRIAFMLGAPPLLDLAYLNVKHWQSQSDQDTILHVARVPILAMIGADDNSELTVGTSSAVKLPMGSDMKFVEHSGAAIEAGRLSLVDLQDQAITTGAELLVKKPGDRSATEAAGDQEGNKSDLQRMTEAMEDSLDQALQFMAEYARLPSGGNVSLFKDFGAATLSDASATLIKDLQAAGLISKETAITELQRRGVLSPEVDPKEEADKVEADGPLPGQMVDGVDADGNPLGKPVATQV
ncbi:DUF4055 domain-containing protein [Pseudoxanthomonas sacheonensis]|uniref:DUF4055 domain-containing protein n=1 Tax=Pseudoxanthomonas sacheonensis TaxID=443615 RepID=UPI0013D5F79E|nr:DUF4055 domain-containing protein [Pseudoxanthomonas sacheonensis]KAF1706278.1 DNA-binding protein [Pseudoxanthomonas sacheonensis]